MHVFPSSLYAAQKAARLGEPYFQCVAPEEEEDEVMVYQVVDVEYDDIWYRHPNFAVRSSRSASLIGTAGSAGSCTRSIYEPVYFVEMNEAFAHVRDIFMTILVTDDAKVYDDVYVDLYGLGMRDEPTAVEADFYAGTNDEANTLIAANVITPETGETSVTVNVADYALAQYAAFLAAGGEGTKILAFRLSLQDDFGCLDACDGSCPIRRVITSRDATTFTISYPESEADAVSSLSDGDVGSASAGWVIIAAVAAALLLFMLAVGVFAYKRQWRLATKAAASVDAHVSKAELGEEKAGPSRDML